MYTGDACDVCCVGMFCTPFQVALAVPVPERSVPDPPRSDAATKHDRLDVSDLALGSMIITRYNNNNNNNNNNINNNNNNKFIAAQTVSCQNLRT